MSYTNKLLIVLGVVLALAGFGFGIEKTTDVPVDIIETEVEDRQSATGTVAEVVYVIDGDTIEIDSGERVRLLGIDTPEMDECYYQEATEFVREQLAGQSVRLVTDATDQDEYGRLLRQVFIISGEGGVEVHLNLRLLQGGYAEVLPIPPDRAYREVFKEAEENAKANGLGRWSEC